MGEAERADSSYRCDSTSLPTLLALSGALEPLSGVFVEPPISALQRGHNAFIWSHLSMHSMWKTCAQGSSRRSSLFENFDKQMQQICRSPIIKFMNYKYVIRSMISEKENGERAHSIFRRNNSLLVSSSCQDSTTIFSHIPIMNPFRFELVRHQGIDRLCGSASVQIQILMDAQNGDYTGQAAAYHCT